MSPSVHLATAVVMLFSQLLLVAVGGPLMVKCQGAGNHEAIELAHATPCGDDAFALTDHEATDAFTSEQFSTGDCVDTPLAQPPVLCQKDRSLLEAMPLLLTYQVAELPAFPAPTFGVSDAPTHVFSPDSAESLARNVILLI